MITAMDKGPPENRAADAGIRIGRVHLQVADLDRTAAFYRVLGFDEAHPLGNGVVLLSVRGAQPEIALSTAAGPESRSPSPVPCRFAIRLTDRTSLAHALGRLTAAGVAAVDAVDQGISEAFSVRDPNGHEVEVYYDRPVEEWPRDASGSVNLTSRPLDLQSLRAAGTGSAPAGQEPASMSEPTRNRLREMRVRLLNLHKVLLEDARVAYEMDRGRIGSNANLLQLVINDPWFAWLHPLSELVVRIDETLQADVPATDADGAALLDQVERLLSPAQSAEAFAQRYYDALQRQPAVIVAHAEVRRILKQAK
jgi:catechol 2,3-dioxygenase-like lactoylglutathione lyase family enzyme